MPCSGPCSIRVPDFMFSLQLVCVHSCLARRTRPCSARDVSVFRLQVRRYMWVSKMPSVICSPVVLRAVCVLNTSVFRPCSVRVPQSSTPVHAGGALQTRVSNMPRVACSPVVLRAVCVLNTPVFRPCSVRVPQASTPVHAVCALQACCLYFV